VDLANLCGGNGTCGRCIVQVVEGEVSHLASREREFLAPAQLAESYRLACQAVALSDCKVHVPPESLTAPQRTQVEGEEVAVSPEPTVHAFRLALAPPSLDDLRADAQRLADALSQEGDLTHVTIDLAVLRELSPRLREANWQPRVAVRRSERHGVGEVIALIPPEGRLLGLAVDLGTTKIAVYLVDLGTGQALDADGIMNPQIAYGEDVISRLGHAQQGPDEATRLRELIASALNKAAARLCASVGARPSEIVEAVVVGNTAMHHLFVGLPVTQLVLAPYVPAVTSPLDLRARELGLAFAPGASVHLLPNIAGYVGADHVAMLLATGVANASGVVLAIDIGTNTEVCLSNRGTLTSTSCASGPAFEGAHIKHGMRAARGAIERLRVVDGEVEFQTIGGAPPVGLCGSGILDALAQLYQAGVVDRRGRMGKHPGVREIDGTREYVLVPKERREDGQGAITFTQKDVRELQLAKGAMRTGINALLEEQRIAASEIDQVIIAGAFGTYIDVASAIAIGMLPDLPLERFRQVGNAAGIGAKLALVSRSKRSEAQALARRVGYAELATDPGFAQAFARAMYLGRSPNG
jgi:uncharacterized 2Fe-2S/4Fe-4S cluster protein (DUF4445 family)